MPQALFVTATDTGVGKTVVSASIASLLYSRGVNVGIMKPFMTGVAAGSEVPNNDAAVLSLAAFSKLSREQVNPALFSHALAPMNAASLENRNVDVESVTGQARDIVSRHQFTIIEGVGGAAVPLTEKTLLSDWMRELGYPALICARDRLGTLNHTYLTHEHLVRKGVEVAGIVLTASNSESGIAEGLAADTIAKMTGARVFGTVPFVGMLGLAETAREVVRLLPLGSRPILDIADFLITNG